MDRVRASFTFALLAALVASLAFATGCQEKTPTPTPESATMHSSRLVAERFLGRCPTFIFDGILGSIDLSTVERCEPPESCFTFFFIFKTTHPGYGDRGGQVLAQVITDHTARITTEDERVTRGVIDDKWDIMAQRFLPGTEP